LFVWSDLNPNQRAAILHDKGPAAVYAGPGSGKTRVAALRTIRLVEQGAQVLLTTFTNDATEEMKARIKPVLSRKSPGTATISTLHALCLSILREQKMTAQLLTRDDQRRGLAEAALAYELEGGINSFLSRVGFLKNTGETVTSYHPDDSCEDREFYQVWQTYEKLKEKRSLVEFDDLLHQTLKLFQSKPDVLLSWAGRFHFIMVDESQDMNKPQYQIALALGKYHHNVMLIGDPDQSLYGFRGADSDTFRNFARHSATRVYELRENYRSTVSIVTFAKSLIQKSPNRREIPFQPVRGEGHPVQWNVYADADTEAMAVGETILQMTDNGAQYKDIAVLYRVNAQSEPFERYFSELGIPYITRQGGDFYSRKEIAGVLAYLEFLEAHADEWLLNFLNIPSRKLSRAVAAEMRRIADFRNKTIWEILPDFTAQDLRSHKSVQRMYRELQEIERKIPFAQNAGDAVSIIRKTTSMDAWLCTEEVNSKDNDRVQNLEQMQEAASHYETISEYLGAVRKVREDAERRKREMKKKRGEVNAVTLCTGHAAKGLEWRFVFGTGWSEQILPHRKAEDIEEERRIAYVIATRAMDRLYISSLQNYNGSTVDSSRFLQDVNISPSLLESEEEILQEDEVIIMEPLGGLFMQ
jgi:DNA helicase-2/ATP-dependent DNA helicase PcrA